MRGQQIVTLQLLPALLLADVTRAFHFAAASSNLRLALHQLHALLLALLLSSTSVYHKPDLQSSTQPSTVFIHVLP